MFFYKKLSPNAIICDIIANVMKCEASPFRQVTVRKCVLLTGDTFSALHKSAESSERERKINYDDRLFYHA